jgi:hypothetical protein
VSPSAISDRTPARPRAAAGPVGDPRVTVAWDLPAGGLYIGLPLAIAAIAIAGLCVAQMAVWTLVSVGS